jgi:hypothetical protein
MTKTETVFTMSVADLQKNVDKAKRLLDEIAALLPGMVTMTEDDRRHSDGKTRDGEPEALTAVADAADFRPQFFAPLADKDGGTDPKRFETDMLRDHIARRKVLSDFLTAGENLTTPISDTVLSLGEQVRPVLLAAYQIAKPIAAQDDALRTKRAPALDFYSRIGRRAATTRQSKSTTPASPPAK